MIHYQKSTLVTSQERFEFFEQNVSNIPVLQQLISNHEQTSFFYALCRDLWIALSEQRYEPILNRETTQEQPLQYTMIKQFIEHPTFEYIVELSHQERQNTLANAFILGDFFYNWLQSEIEQKTFHSEGARLQYVLELTSFTQAIEGSAQYLTHMYERLNNEPIDFCKLMSGSFATQAAFYSAQLFEIDNAGVTRFVYQAKYKGNTIV